MSKHQQTFDAFRAKCEAAGYRAKDHGAGHWQIVGAPLIVNFYPAAPHGPKVYVCGTKAGFHGNANDAIKAAASPPPMAAVKDSRSSKGRRKRVRRNLLRRNPHCVWCDKKLDRETATIEHVIPLARGGLDNENNMRLACLKCNLLRGNSMPELHAAKPIATAAALPTMGYALIVDVAIDAYAFVLDGSRIRIGSRIGQLMPILKSRPLDEWGKIIRADFQHRFEIAKALATQIQIASTFRVNRGTP